MRYATLSVALCAALAAATTGACVGLIGDGDGAAVLTGAEANGPSPSSRCGPEIGVVTVHRLNNTEYDNTIRDLLGDNSRLAAAKFPIDDSSFGFDNNADVLSLSPALLETYSNAAGTLAHDALAGPARATIMTCDPSTGDACARTILGAFAKRAWRRPVTDEELGELVKLLAVATAQGDPVERGIELGLQVILASPNFIYRAEIDPDPASTVTHPLNDYELASRLSYFLWSTMPDDGLFAAADAGKFTRDGAELGRQVDRMLTDPRSEALVDRFAMQWLTAAFEHASPAAEAFPAFKPDLRTAMLGETREYMRSFMFGDVNFLDLMDANYTWVNGPLATHYGLPGISGDAMTRVPLGPEAHRGGLLTQASILTLTSTSTRTVPTRRGNWVLTNLLCEPPPPPPPNTPALPPTSSATTIRARLEEHRKNPVCASCHALMDPIGLGMESYDGIGAWRTTDKGSDINVSGALPNHTSPDGTPFNGTAELQKLIKADPRFATCAASKLFAFAVGRAPTGGADTCRMSALGAPLGNEKYHMKDLIKTVVTDESFRMRHGG